MKNSKYARMFAISLLVVPYIAYLAFIIMVDQGPVDFETFLEIGHRFRVGEEVYLTNSYYPLPFVMIFAFLDWLPRWLSMLLWLGAPPITALMLTGGSPYALAFAPVLSNFFGGQSAVFAMVGLWGYRKNRSADHWKGGAFLALTFLKPQLGILPLVYAAYQWVKLVFQAKKLPRQAAGFVATLTILYLPSFIVSPTWLIDWLYSPRGIFERAIAGFIPRTLLMLLSPQNPLFWILLVGLSAFLFLLIFRAGSWKMTFDQFMLWSFVVNPLVHDYDLIQLVPIIESHTQRLLAVLLSIPGIFVIFFAYQSDSAWFVFSLIPPVLLAYSSFTQKRVSNGTERVEAQQT